MADRNVYGRDFSENGWRMVDQGSCVWVRIPGAPHVSLQIREGQPAKILGAFVADWHAYIEPIRDADSACWTPTNSVASSNHLSGTACDINWNSHPFRVKDAGFNGAQLATMREMLKFYEDTVFWGNDWQNPRDSMHVQMGGNTYGAQNVDRVQDFINRKIRSDGFSTFRRAGNVPVQPPADNSAKTVLARAVGVTPEKAGQILVGVQNGLRDSQCVNVNRIAMWLAQMGHESAGFNATEEYASGAAYEGRRDLGNTQPGDGVRFKGRSWIQVTGRSNYAQLSKWAHSKGIVSSPTFFVDDSTRLGRMEYAGLGPAWYWTVARPDINALSDNRDLVTVTRRINGGTNGLTDRRARYDRALALGNDLLTLTSSTPRPPGDDMAQVPQDQWDRVYKELTQRLPSRSPLRHVGEGAVDTVAGFILNVDGSQHVEIVTRLAKYGDPDALALLREVAGTSEPDRQHDAQLAQAILADVTKPDSTGSQLASAAGQSGAAVSVPPSNTRELADAYSQLAAANAENARLRAELAAVQPSTAVVAQPGSTGEQIGHLYDALEQLRLADAAPIEQRAPMQALVQVLTTKNGTQL